jgi:hypothetical protein
MGRRALQKKRRGAGAKLRLGQTNSNGFQIRPRQDRGHRVEPAGSRNPSLFPAYSVSWASSPYGVSAHKAADEVMIEMVICAEPVHHTRVLLDRRKAKVLSA